MTAICDNRSASPHILVTMGLGALTLETITPHPLEPAGREDRPMGNRTHTPGTTMPRVSLPSGIIGMDCMAFSPYPDALWRVPYARSVVPIPYPRFTGSGKTCSRIDQGVMVDGRLGKGNPLIQRWL